jgi:hypothetical protein
VSLADALEAAAGALPNEAEAIRPANGDALRLLEALPAEGAARVAAWLIAERPADAAELARLWCEAPAGQVALLAVEEAGLSKESRKLLRRLHHGLRSRGLHTPAPAPTPTVARLPELEDSLDGAFVSGFDPMGARQLWWIEPHPSGGPRLFECAIDDARGVLAFEVYTPTRSDLRRFVKRLAADAHATVFPLDAETAKALVLHAAERQAADRPAPRRWVEWRGRLGGAAAVKLPGALVSDALGAGDGAEALGAAAALVRDGRIGPWPPLRAVLAPLVERFRTTLDSPLVVSAPARREQAARLVDEAASGVFEGEAGAVAAHRLRESAWCFWRRGEEDEARACLAAARAFEAQPAAENPVARAFVEFWLRPLLTAASGEAPPPETPAESPLLVRP